MAQRTLEELLAADEAGTLDVTSLSADEQNLIMNGGGDTEPEVETEPKDEDETKQGDVDTDNDSDEDESTSTGIEDGTEEEKTQRPKKKNNSLSDLKRELRERSNELNTYKQRYEALNRKIEKGEYTPKKAEIDRASLWDDDTMVARMQKLEEMEAKFKTLEQREQQLAQQQAMDKVFREIEEFQGKFSHLKTDTDIREINNIYIELASNGTTPSDEDLLEAGIKKKDVQKYLKLLEVDQHKRANGLRTFKAAYYDSGIADEYSVSEDPAESTARSKTQESFTKAEGQPKVLKGGYSSQGGADTWDEARMAQWLEKHPDATAYTAKDKEIFNTIFKRLGL